MNNVILFTVLCTVVSIEGQYVWLTATLSIARASPAAAACRNQVLFAGGTMNFGLDFVAASIVDIFSPSSGWTTATLSANRTFIAAATCPEPNPRILYFSSLSLI